MDYKVKDYVKKSIYTNLEDIANAPISWDKLRGKTLLLTGAGGFIGYYMTCGILLRNDLYGDNIKVLALERFGDFAKKKFGKLLDRDDVELIVQDITEPIKAERADFVIHAASQASACCLTNTSSLPHRASLMSGPTSSPCSSSCWPSAASSTNAGNKPKSSIVRQMSGRILGYFSISSYFCRKIVRV